MYCTNRILKIYYNNLSLHACSIFNWKLMYFVARKCVNARVRRNMVRYLKIFCLLSIVLSCGWDKSNTVTSIPNSFSGQVRLIEAKCCPPGCGVIAWANAQKFEVIKSTAPSLNGKSIILVEKCPEFLGDGFFKNGQIYNVKATNKKDSSYLLVGLSERETLPVYWSDKIELQR
jgi:hypothetical protein